jgi:hypothetical protein
VRVRVFSSLNTVFFDLYEVGGTYHLL